MQPLEYRGSVVGVCRTAEQLLDDGAGGGLGEGFLDVVGGSFGVAVEHPAKQLLLVAEGGVQARRVWNLS